MRASTLPLWLRWVLSTVVFGGLLVALVIVVSNSGSAMTAVESPASAAQANRLGQKVTAQDQSPHHAVLPASIPPGIALQRAILSDMRTLVSSNDLRGPVGRVSCTPAKRHAPGRLPFHCIARAGGFNYPFDGVADTHAHKLIWCKNDRTIVDPGLEVPLNPACTG